MNADPVSYGYSGYGDSGAYEQGDAAYEEQVEQASELATAGQADEMDHAEWLPLGVFAMLPEGQSQANAVVQLAISQEGIIKGSYYDVLTNADQPLSGSIDRDTQRAAWSLDANKAVVYETGLENLTRDEAPLLVHFNASQTRKWLMVRMKEDAADEK